MNPNLVQAFTCWQTMKEFEPGSEKWRYWRERARKYYTNAQKHVTQQVSQADGPGDHAQLESDLQST